MTIKQNGGVFGRNPTFRNVTVEGTLTGDVAGLAVGTDVQAYDAGLNSIAGLTTSADKMIYATASDTYAVTDLTAAGRALLDDADASAQRTTLGLTDAATQTFATGNFTPYFFTDVGGEWPGKTTDSGYYFRIGTLVHIIGKVTWSGKAAGAAGTLRVRNLPFSANNPGNPSIAEVDHTNNLGDGIQIRISTTDFLFYDGGALQGNALRDALPTSGEYRFNATYRI